MRMTEKNRERARGEIGKKRAKQEGGKTERDPEDNIERQLEGRDRENTEI